MVQVIEGRPGLGAILGQGLGAGLAQGLGTSSEITGQSMLERLKQKQRLQTINAIEEQFAGKKSLSQEIKEPAEPSLIQDMQRTEDPFAKAQAYAAIGEHELAKLETERAKLSEKRKMAQEERGFLPEKKYIEHGAERSTKYLDSVSAKEDEQPFTKASLAMIEDALGDADAWAAFKDRLADATKFEGFRSAAGAELDSAVKGYLLGDIQRIKGRPNQFMEKQIRDAYVRAGIDPIANQKIFVGMQLKDQINSLETEIARNLEEKYVSEKGYLPPNFESLVKKEMKPGVDKIEKEAIDKLHHMSKIEQQRDKLFRSYVKPGEQLMMSPEGEPFAVPNKEVDLYKSQGYISLGKK